MVIVSDAQVAVTPDGKPLEIPIPCVAVVVCVIAVNAVFLHKVGAEEAVLTVLFGFTVIVPVAFILPQPPLNGIL